MTSQFTNVPFINLKNFCFFCQIQRILFDFTGILSFVSFFHTFFFYYISDFKGNQLDQLYKFVASGYCLAVYEYFCASTTSCNHADSAISLISELK